MNSRRITATLAAALVALPLFIGSLARAQDQDLGTLVNKALQAMKEEKWQEALQFNTEAVERFGRNQPLMLFGPKFGSIYYRKGICEMKLGKWDEAIKSFETCARDFPNKNPIVRENPFIKMSLLRIAESAMGAQNWELALTNFEKFLKERDPELDKFPQGPFHTSMAICYYKLGRVPEGNDQLEIAIKNKRTFPTSDSSIMASFQELVGAVVLKRNEQALLDFIGKNRGELTVDAYLMHRFSKVFLKLAGDAINADMDRAAFALYQLIPSTDAVIDDLRARLRKMGPLPRLRDVGNLMVRANLEKALTEMEGERRGKRSIEMIKLAATAYLHEKAGNTRGAYAAYLQLENFYPTAEKREDNLYNLVRTSSMVGNASETLAFADTFIKTFPDSKHAPLVRRMMLSGLYFDGEYETCIEIAEPMLETLEPGSPEHDTCLHVLGGSYYYTGQSQKAQPLLDQHVEKYPKSLFTVAAQYLRASNLTRIQNWSKAAGLLDEFIKNNPNPADNIYLPFALFDRANCHFLLEQPDPALDIISRLVREFPNARVIDQALILRGNIEQSLENFDRAEKAYLAALDAADKLHHKPIGSEAIFSIISLFSQPALGRLKDAVPFADRFWSEYADESPFRARVAMVQFPALAAVNRTDDGLQRLRDIIIETVNGPDDSSLEILINTYTDAYLTKHTPEELKEHYYAFPGIRNNDLAARALLRVDIIRVFEEVARKGEDDVKRKAKAMIKVLFQQMKTDFALKDLTNSILIKVGNFLRTNTATPRESLPYYDEVLNRKEGKDKTDRFKALLGRADVLGKSASPADIDKALADFDVVFNESEEKPDREFALYRTVQLLDAKKDYAAAADKARLYLDREKTGFAKYAPEVGMLLANSFDQRNMVDDALAMFTKIWSAHTGRIEISAPAMKRWMELTWQRNKPSKDPNTLPDRQGAYQGGAEYIEMTSRKEIQDKMTEKEHQLWKEVENLVQTYEADPSIKSMDEIKREKESQQKLRIRR